ncbi:hypothetical protein COCNU_04G005920 [Cocos nucifera]|uniref:Peptidase C14 caspase domain-containing protein n=1 Tax=Cocos nucifera TaxID=13894 RepID=A0A8K0N064_COCNU|nr:hypothetical protein COCNU_04G005920 [Cocos nucifera]
MANPRRTSLQLQQQNPTLPFSDPPPSPPPPRCSSTLSAVAVFLKRPQAFPILLSVFVLLTWLSLRLQSPGGAAFGLRSHAFPSQAQGKGSDTDANLVRFSAVEFPSQIARDWRGWLLDPVTVAREAGIHVSILESASKGNMTINKEAVYQKKQERSGNIFTRAKEKMLLNLVIMLLENARMKDKGFAEVSIGVDEVAVAECDCLYHLLLLLVINAFDRSMVFSSLAQLDSGLPEAAGLDVCEAATTITRFGFWEYGSELNQMACMKIFNLTRTEWHMPINKEKRRLATLVGCNYPNTQHELHGCINDVHAMSDVLVARFGFDRSDILILTDASGSPSLPTGANIKRALASMIARAQPGDVLFFHYSGHGTLIPAVKPHHSWHGHDEAIVPCDFNLITGITTNP